MRVGLCTSYLDTNDWEPVYYLDWRHYIEAVTAQLVYHLYYCFEYIARSCLLVKDTDYHKTLDSESLIKSTQIRSLSYRKYSQFFCIRLGLCFFAPYREEKPTYSLYANSRFSDVDSLKQLETVIKY